MNILSSVSVRGSSWLQRERLGLGLGLLFIPLIGSASDQCNSSYGRRRPFIWLLSLGVLLALLIIPHADFLAAHFSWGGRHLQVGFLILGVGLLADFQREATFWIRRITLTTEIGPPPNL